MRYFATWLQGDSAPTGAISISGMGGIGKSALLREMLHVAGELGASTFWMDGRACNRSPAGFLDYLQTMLGVEKEGGGWAEPLEALAALSTDGRRLVLGIDNFEELSVVEGWLREVCFGYLPSTGVLLVLASRPGVSASWGLDPAWRKRLKKMLLSTFSRLETQEYLDRVGMEGGSAQEDVYRETGGHPLAVALLGELMKSSGGSSQVKVGAVPGAISASLLREVASPELYPLLEALAVLLEADQGLLEQMVGEPLNYNRYQALAQFSAVRQTDGGLTLHDVARHHLLADLQVRNQDRFRHLRRRAVGLLRMRMVDTVDPSQRRSIAARLLTISREALPSNFWYELSATGKLRISSARAEDKDALHTFLELRCRDLLLMPRASIDQEHRLLDIFCDQNSDNVWVARSTEGRALAFLAPIPFHSRTLPYLRQSALGSMYLEQCSEEELASFACSPAEADTYMTVMGGPNGVEGELPQPTEFSFREAMGALLSEYLSLLGEGMRILGGSNLPSITAYLRLLGATPVPGCCAFFGPSPHPFELYHLDLRQRDFGAWVSAFLDSVEGVTDEGIKQAPKADDLRAALALLNHPVKLERCSLAKGLGCSGSELRQRITTIIDGRKLKGSLTKEERDILKTMALGGRDKTADALAQGLNISRATYYRRLKAALEALGEALRHDFYNG